MHVYEAVGEYLAACHSLSKHTQLFYDGILKTFAQWCDDEHVELEDLRVAHIRKFMAYVSTRPNQRNGKPLSDRSIHHYARVVKGFLNWCGNHLQDHC